MQWVNLPTEPGWYFFARVGTKWSNATPIKVLEIAKRSKTVLATGIATGISSVFDDKMGLWYGPIILLNPTEVALP